MFKSFLVRQLKGKGSSRDNWSTKKKLGVGVVSLVIILAIAGGFYLSQMQIENHDSSIEEGNLKTLSSVDLTLSTYFSERFSGGVRIRARNIESSEYPDLRYDFENNPNAIIFTDEGNSYYFHDTTSDMWLSFENFDYPKNLANNNLKRWVKDVGGERTNTISWKDKKLEITVNKVNPTLKDNLFEPPENANIRKMNG